MGCTTASNLHCSSAADAPPTLPLEPQEARCGTGSGTAVSTWPGCPGLLSLQSPQYGDKALPAELELSTIYSYLSITKVKFT